jgi:hypothetical protein
MGPSIVIDGNGIDAGSMGPSIFIDGSGGSISS